jgi:CRP-like cAMP-binding protein
LDARNALGPLVDKLRRLGTLSDDDAAAVLALPHHVRAVRHMATLIHQGDTPDHCTLMLSGIAARDRTTNVGARQFLGFYVRGDFIDLNSGLIGCAHDNVQVFGAADVACIPLDALVRLAFERPAIGQLLWVDTLIDASIAREWTINVGRRDARTRLLHLLCELAVRQQQAALGPPDELTLSLTQEQLGDALGLTAVHVNRMLQSLRDVPAIERDGRTIRILDWRTLMRLADFDPTYLQSSKFMRAPMLSTT